MPDNMKITDRAYKDLFENSLDGFVMVDINGKILNANNAYCNMLGYTLDELKAKKDFYEITPPEWRDLERTEYWEKQLLQKGYSGIYRKEYIRKDGSIFPVELRVYLVRNSKGSIIYVWAIVRDITESVKLVAELKESRELLENTQEISKVGGWSFDIEHQKMTWTRETYRIHGFEPAADQNLIELSLACYTDDVRSLVHKAYNLCMEKGTPYKLELPFIKKTGEHIWVETTGRAIIEKGRVIKILGNIIDITEKKQTENSIKKNEEKYRLLVNRLPDIVARFDRKRQYLFVSDNIEEVTGVAAERYIGQYIYDIWGKAELAYFWSKCIDEVLSSGKSLEEEFSFIDIKGENRTFNWRMSPEHDLSGNVESVLSICRDITEHRKLEKEYRTLFREMLDGFALHEIITDNSGNPVNYRFIDVNPAFERMTGLKKKNIQGKTVLDVLPHTEYYWIETYGKVALTGGPAFFENYSKEIDKYFEVAAFRPAPDQFACIFSDITYRKKTEQQIIRQSRVLSAINEVFHKTLNAHDEKDVAEICLELAKKITESSMGFIGEINSEGLLNTLVVNSKECNWFNSKTARSIDELNNMNIRGIWGSVVKNGRSFFTNTPSSHPDWYGPPENHPKINSFLGVPLLMGDRVFGVIAVGNSKSKYTENNLEDLENLSFAFVESLNRCRAQKELKKSQQTLVSLFNAIRESVLLLDKNGIILAANKTLAHRMNTVPEELIGHHATYMLPEDIAEKRMTIISDVIRTGKSFEFKDKRGDRFFHHSMWPVTDSNGTVELIAIYAADITEIKQAEAEKELLQSQLIQAQKMESVGRLAGGVAHDFNNMMGVILGLTDMILEEMTPEHPLHADLTEIQKAAIRSTGLTQQLLAFARKQTVSPEVLDLNSTIDGMLKMLERLIGEDVELKWIPGSRVGPVFMDPSQIDQILVNLCVNARDATGSSGYISIETAEVSFDQEYCKARPDFIPGNYAMISVADAGSGMDKETVSRLFEPFFTTKEMGKGTGLGLSTIYGIVKQNNGFITVYSEIDKGTIFKVFLPLHISKTETEYISSVQKKQLPGGKETVLLVEDEPAILNMTTLMLRRQGYSVLPAATPGEAIETASKQHEPIHLLMTDVVMPEMNGRDLAKIILGIHPGIQRLFMSGYTADVIAHHGVLNKGVYFIQKPFTMKELAEKVRTILDESK